VYEALVSLPQVDKPNTVSIINNDTKAVEYYIRGQINVNINVMLVNTDRQTDRHKGHRYQENQDCCNCYINRYSLRHIPFEICAGREILVET